jgi:hypothetical protein
LGARLYSLPCDFVPEIEFASIFSGKFGKT